MQQPLRVDTIKKHTKPTSLDFVCQGAVWEEVCEDGNNKFYIQCSNTCLQSNWLTLGEFFEKSFEEFKLQKDFLDIAFRMYKRNTAPKAEEVIEMIVGIEQKR